MPEITLVLGVDAKTLPQFEVSHRTWKLHQPKIWSWPWVVFYDGTIETMPLMLDTLKAKGAFPQNAKFVPWPHCVGGNSRSPKYENQREKMLTGFCYVPAEHVETPFWMKLDTDSVCITPKPMYEPEWFERDASGRHLAWIASAWPYSKPGSQPGKLDDWGDGVPELADKPRLNVPVEPGAGKAFHPRMASWMSYYSLEFTQFAAGLAERSVGRGLVPVPSQDGYHFYVAHRYGWPYKTSKMKRRGWTNVPRLSSLIETVQTIMRGEAAESICDS